MAKKQPNVKDIRLHIRIVKHVTVLSAYLLIVWGLYRFLFKLPEEIEEIMIKPLVWLIPVYFFTMRERLSLSSLGFTTKNTLRSVYLALSLGVLFAIEGFIVNFFKYNGFDFAANIGSTSLFAALGISLATAFSEEVTFRGYIFGRLWMVMKNEWLANLVTSFVWALIHIPIAIFWWNLSFSATAGYLLLTTIFGIGAAFVYARTKNIMAPILLHVLWEWPIILFR